MNKLFAIFATFIISISAVAQQIPADSVMGRPFKEFSTTAFCNYNSFHPVNILLITTGIFFVPFVTPDPLQRSIL